MAPHNFPRQPELSATKLLKSAEYYANLATKNATYTPEQKLFMPGVSGLVAATARQSTWRSRDVPMTFTHKESGETVEGTGRPEVTFRVIVPSDAKHELAPSMQVQFRLGTIATAGPISEKNWLGRQKPINWQESWDSDLPVDALYSFDYSKETRPTTTGAIQHTESDPRLERILLHQKGHAYAIYGHMILGINELPLVDLRIIDQHLQMVAPGPAKR